MRYCKTQVRLNSAKTRNPTKADCLEVFCDFEKSVAKETMVNSLGTHFMLMLTLNWKQNMGVVMRKIIAIFKITQILNIYFCSVFMHENACQHMIQILFISSILFHAVN